MFFFLFFFFLIAQSRHLSLGEERAQLLRVSNSFLGRVKCEFREETAKIEEWEREREKEVREKLEGKVDFESLGVKNNGTSQQSRFFSPLIPQRRRNGRSWKFFAFIERVVKEEQSSGML